MRDALRGACMVGLCVLGVSVGEASPWGNEGHTIICEIAFQELKLHIKEQVKDLMRQDSEFRTFAASCTWPDLPPRRRREEHFINFPRITTTVQTEACPQATKCLFTAIRQDTEVLSDSQATKQHKLESLKYLGHWVGDIHQPLHLSYEDDRGGNSIRGSGLCHDDLHAVWDTCLIENGLGQDANAVATQLRGEITPEERRQWTNASPVAWANESYALATMANVEYCVQKDGACQYAADRKAFQEGEPQRTVTVNEAYITAHTPTVKSQLKKAGVRLGHLLNAILGSP